MCPSLVPKFLFTLILVACMFWTQTHRSTGFPSHGKVLKKSSKLELLVKKIMKSVKRVIDDYSKLSLVTVRD